MKNLYTFFLALFLSAQSFGQVAVGTGTTPDYGLGPVNTYYAYSYHQTIYKAIDINASGMITSIQYKLTSDNVSISNSDDQVDVWIGHTTKNQFNNEYDWVDVNTLTKVLNNGSLERSGTTVTITFETPFNYNGVDNLIIAIDGNEPGSNTSSDTYFCSKMNSGETVNLYSRDDSINPNPNDPSGITNSYTNHFYPNIIINGITPTCPRPSGLSVSNITEETAHLDWTENGSSNSWTIEYGLAGFTPGNGTILNVNTNSHTLTGLTPSTQYEFYVKSNCSNDDSSSYAGPKSFATSCGIIRSEYSANFAEYPPICWDKANGEMGSELNYGTSRWRGNRGFTNDNGEVVKTNAMNFWSNFMRTWLVSNSFDLTSGELSLETLVAVTAYSFSGITAQNQSATMGSDDKVYLLISTDDGTTWTELQVWDVNNQPTANGTKTNFDLSNYTGIVKFAFYATDGSVDDAEDYDFHVGGLKMVSNNLAVNDVKNNKSHFEFYPNPVNNLLFIKGERNVENVKIYDITGKLVYQNTFNKNIAEINVSSLTSGQYIINANIDGTMQNMKIIKK